MSTEKSGSLEELAILLENQTKKKKETALRAETERFMSIEEYLQCLENLLSGEPDGKTLRYWIDSSALVLGKNLAIESFASAQGKNVAEGISEMTAIEQEITTNTERLRKTAEAADMTVEELLGDKENEIVREVTRLREEKTTQVAELRTALQAYALELVHTLQEGNRRKLGMTREALATWEEKFAAVDVLPQDYGSYVARVEQDFVATKRRSVEAANYNETLVESKEHLIAVNDKV